jgi:hypothetical protein
VSAVGQGGGDSAAGEPTVQKALMENVYEILFC